MKFRFIFAFLLCVCLNAQHFAEKTLDIGEDSAYVKSMIWADLNNDDYKDLLIWESLEYDSGNCLKIYINKKDKSFYLSENILEKTDAPDITVKPVDTDRDGLKDLFAGSGQNNFIYRISSGNFVAEDGGIDLKNQKIISAEPGDFNQDGTLDLCLFDNSGEKIIFFNRKSGNLFEDKFIASNNDSLFVPYQKENISADTEVFFMPDKKNLNLNDSLKTEKTFFADFDNNGEEDVLILYENANLLELFIRKGNSFVFHDRFLLDDKKVFSYEDFDNDGDIDIFAIYNGKIKLYENTQLGNWIKFVLIDKEKRENPVGTEIKIAFRPDDSAVESETVILEEAEYLEFGLKNAEKADSVKIIWNDGRVLNLYNLPANEIYTVVDENSSLTIDSVFILGDEDIRVGVTAEQLTDYSSFELQISGFYGQLEYLEIEKENCVLAEYNMMILDNDTGDGVKIAGAGTETVTDDGVLFYLKFNRSIESGTVPINIDYAVFDTYYLENLEHGIVRVMPIIPGDANLDGVVNFDDVDNALDCILGETALDSVEFANADVNQNNSVSTMDAFLIYNSVEDGTELPVEFDSVSGSLSADDEIISVNPGEDFSLPLNLYNVIDWASAEITIKYDPQFVLFRAEQDSVPDCIYRFVSVSDSVEIALAFSEFVSREVSLPFRFSSDYEGDFESDIAINFKTINDNHADFAVNFHLIREVSHKDEEEISEPEFKFFQYPNPVLPDADRSVSTVEFTLPKASKVKLAVYNIKGQMIKLLIDKELSEGSHCVDWHIKDEDGKNIPSGQYFYKLTYENKELFEKVLIVK
ncbi:MAG: hypothetical protein CSB55_03800 [Candidatus Cloacimonadota bacterium]|nr:MAG: hypothetical protein CSB55_03800 [Candidatus Cloacimonadota bacterium]